MCLEECFNQEITLPHPMPLALGQQCSQGPLFLKPWPAHQTPKASSATLCLRFSYHITSLHTHSSKSPYSCEARTDTRLNAVYFRPCRTRHSFLQIPSSSAPNTAPPPPMHKLPPASCHGPPAVVPGLNKTPPCCQLLLAASQYNPERSLPLSSPVS